MTRPTTATRPTTTAPTATSTAAQRASDQAAAIGGGAGGALGGAATVARTAPADGATQVLQQILAAMQQLVASLPPVTAVPMALPQSGVLGMQGAPQVMLVPTTQLFASQAIAPAGGEDHAFEQEVLQLVNQIRLQNGLQPLRYNAQLDAAAEKHNIVQAQRRTMAHVGLGDGDPGSRIRGEGFTGRWGENVAVGQRSAAQVVREWMASPSHRANILNPAYQQMGVSFVTTADGVPFWAQNFGS